MRIGIYFAVSKNQGGVYQYSVNLLNILKEIKNNEYFILNFSHDLPYKNFQLKNWHILNFYNKKNYSLLFFINNLINFIITITTKIKLKSLSSYFFKIKNKIIKKIIKKNKIDIIFFPASFNLQLLKEFPAIASIHDIQHKLNPQFPEVSQKGIAEKREHNYQSITKYAKKILVDSEISKEDIAHYYKADPNNIVVLPYLPPTHLKNIFSDQEKEKLINKYKLPKKFLFYPAQFWPHKNHINLVKALDILKKQKINIPIILTGSSEEKWGEFQRIMNFIKDHKMEKQVLYLGYLDNNEINILYKLATALVMPTFFGPTNIPILEAWQMDCPVLYSNIRGCREQAEDAAILFNPSDPQDIAKKIKKLWLDDNLKKELIIKGKKRLNNWTQKDYIKKLNNILINLKI